MPHARPRAPTRHGAHMTRIRIGVLRRAGLVSVIRPYHDATCSRATSHEGCWPFLKAARGGGVRADTGRAAVRHGRINLTNLPARVAPRPVPCRPVRQGQARPASSCPPRQAVRGRGRAPDACGVQDDTHREDARFFPCVRAFIASSGLARYLRAMRCESPDTCSVFACKKRLSVVKLPTRLFRRARGSDNWMGSGVRDGWLHAKQRHVTYPCAR